MTSGSSFELALARDAEIVESAPFSPSSAIVRHVRLRADFDARRDQVVLTRLDPASEERARLSVLGEVRAVLDGTVRSVTTRLADLVQESGAIELVLEVERLDRWLPLGVAVLQLRGTAEQDELKIDLIEALERERRELSRDVLGTFHEGITGLSLELMPRLERLERFAREFDRAVASLGPVARATLERRRVEGRWRPGMDLSRARRVDFDRGADGGELRPTNVRRLLPRTTFDLAEHRHVASALRQVEQRAGALAAYASSALRTEDRSRDALLSASERERAAARRELIRSARARARAVADRAARHLGAEEWLNGVGDPRRELSSTPLFRRVPAYAQAYDLLQRWGRQERSVEPVAHRFQSLPKLFETWVFLRVARAIERWVGHADEVAGSVARAGLHDLRPGDSIVFPLDDGGEIRLTQEPIVAPLGRSRGGEGTRFAAALSIGALRPDVWLERVRPGRRSRVAVLDAKCTASFRSAGSSASPGDLLEGKARDYRSRVVDPRTGYQPVRALFLVHYAADLRLQVNVPQLLTGCAPDDGYLCGALGATPRRADHLELVVPKILDWL